MRKLFRSFYAKLSGIFLVLLIILGVVDILIAMQFYKRFVQEADQQLNLNLASDMAFELRPVLKNGIDLPKIENLIHYMMVMNPKVEIYLLNSNGKILAYFTDPPKKVQKATIDLIPIHTFLKATEKSLILGEDPLHPSRQKPFSAASLTIGENDSGYLYIILSGEKFETASSMILESYIAKTTMMGLVITLLFTGIIGLILFALLTRRLKVITAAVKNFEQGELHQRIPIKSRDELDQLGNSFNHMADTIVENIELLKQTDSQRRELIANVSHDLRSPLSSIQGYLETIQMKEESLSQEQRREYLEIILNNTVMLNRLVEELFELSKLEANLITPNYEAFSLAELTQDLVMKFKPRAKDREIVLEIDLQDNVPYVYADIGLIERALSNIIENSFRYTPEKGTVKVSVSHDENMAKVAVSDNGRGISEHDLPHIFERFYRVDKSRSNREGGAGLGLAISKKILELHNITVHVVSEIDVGTTFHFSLTTFKEDNTRQKAT